MAEAIATTSVLQGFASGRSRRRILVEVAIAYALILLVVWTPRPWQKLLWWVAAAAVAVIAGLSFNGLKALGLGRTNFLRSLWIAGAALLLAAVAVVVAGRLHTLNLPGSTVLFIHRYWAYALWACVQQLLLQGFFLPRFFALLNNKWKTVIVTAGLFALAHLPNPILTPITLFWGFAACLLFLRYRNLYPLAMAHAIFGIAIAIAVPGGADHNMRVGLGYLTYHHHAHLPARSSQP